MSVFDPLATVTDLTKRGIDTINDLRVQALLAAASAEVRAAAGVPISRATWTTVLPGAVDPLLRLPGQPVVEVSDVELDEQSVTDWVLWGGNLWRGQGWSSWHRPSNVKLTVTGGLVEVPGDIVDLVCSLVGMGLANAEDGYESKVGKAYESIDDYRVGYHPGNQLVGVMELPKATRLRLRARFGGGAS